MESWGGSRKTLIAKIQIIQDQVTKLTVPIQHRERNARQRQLALGWLSINNEIIRVTHTLTHKIINNQEPKELCASNAQKHQIFEDFK